MRASPPRSPGSNPSCRPWPPAASKAVRGWHRRWRRRGPWRRHWCLTPARRSPGRTAQDHRQQLAERLHRAAHRAVPPAGMRGLERIDFFFRPGCVRTWPVHAPRHLPVFGGRADQPRRRPVGGKLGAHPRRRAPLADLPREDRADRLGGSIGPGPRHRHGRPWSGEEARMSQRRPVIAAWAVRMARGLYGLTVTRCGAPLTGWRRWWSPGWPPRSWPVLRWPRWPPGTLCRRVRLPRRCAAGRLAPGARDAAHSRPASGYGDQATVRASWTAPHGRRRTGMVPVTRPRPRRHQRLEGRLQPPTPPQHARLPGPSGLRCGCTYR